MSRLHARAAGSAVSVAALLLLIAPAATAADTPAATGGPVFDATSYGAVCDGILRSAPNGGTVDGDAIQAAVWAAERSPDGGTVVLPAGTCNIGTAILLASGKGVTLDGTVGPSGQYLTTLTDTVNPKGTGGALSITSGHNVVQDLILDESHYGGAVYIEASNTIIRRTTILGGPQWYALFAGKLKTGAPAVGNRLVNSTVVSLINREVLGGAMACDDGLTWANQTDSVIKNLTFVGTRLGLYQDTDSLVNGFTYYPGPQTCDLDGWYVTQPSSDLTLDNLTMHGSAGTIGNGNLGNGAINDLSITDETVDPPAAAPGYTLSGPSHGLSVVNVHGMTLTDSSLASGVAANSSINFQPTGSDSDVTISSTTVPRVSFWGVSAKGSTTIGKVTDVGLTDDTFPAVGTAYGSNADTVLEGDSTVTSFTVHGGTWENQQAGTPTGFFAGNGPVTYSIHGLQGY